MGVAGGILFNLSGILRHVADACETDKKESGYQTELCATWIIWRSCHVGCGYIDLVMDLDGSHNAAGRCRRVSFFKYEREEVDIIKSDLLLTTLVWDRQPETLII